MNAYNFRIIFYHKRVQLYCKDCVCGGGGRGLKSFPWYSTLWIWRAILPLSVGLDLQIVTLQHTKATHNLMSSCYLLFIEYFTSHKAFSHTPLLICTSKRCSCEPYLAWFIRYYISQNLPPLMKPTPGLSNTLGIK